MGAEILNGTQMAAALQEDIRTHAGRLAQNGVVPSLAVIIVGDNPASHSYIRAKKRACAATHIATSDAHFADSITERELLDHIDTLNRDASVDGILIQLPLPSHINENAVLCAVDPQKDVDGFHPHNVGLLTLGTPRFEPCTPRGITHMLTECGARVASANVVIVGRSAIVGKPLALMLMRKADNANATVTVCHSATNDMAAHTRRADILIVAVGAPKTITADMVKPGAVVIDVGVNRVTDSTHARGYRLCGDVDFEAVSKVAGKITPVPGGVGPMTIAMLLRNTVDAAQRRMERQTKQQAERQAEQQAERRDDH